MARQISKQLLQEVTITFLGLPGPMLSGSKIAPEGQTIVWNANVCVKSQGKLWFGDLNITLDADQLQKMANQIGETVYILREMDARFKLEDKPQFSKSVATFSPMNEAA